MKLLKICILILLMFGINNISIGQEKNEEIDSVRIRGTAGIVIATYDDDYSGAQYFEGIVGYQFTLDNYVDTVDYIILEGSYGDYYVPIDTLSNALDGEYSLFDENPNYLKYRLRIPLISGDTAVLKNNIYFEKRLRKR